MKKILDSTPEGYYFTSDNPLNKVIENYEKEYSRALSGEIEGDEMSYFMSGISYDISNLKKQIELNSRLYHATYGCISFNMKVVYYMIEKFNIYTGRLGDSDYNKLNNSFYNNKTK